MNLSSKISLTVYLQQQLKLLALVLFCLLFVSACVTESTTSKSPSKEATIRKQPDLNEAAEQRLNLGLQYLQNGQVERAKHHLDKALLHAPNKPSVQIGLAYYNEQVKEYARARKYYLKALRSEPNNGDYLNLFGTFLCNRGDYKAAEKYFKKSVARPDYANVASTYENSGVCAKRSGNLVLAESSFRKALDHNSRSAISLLEMAEIWFLKKNYMQARAFLSRHFEVAQVSAKSLLLGIDVETILGDMDDLSTYKLKLTGMFPNSEEAKIYLNSIKE